MKRLVIIIVFVLTGCNKATPSETINTGPFPIEAYDMADGVRCYRYPSYALSCVKVKP
jgi:hypothetical protein